jgi:hypothetical protein
LLWSLDIAVRGLISNLCLENFALLKSTGQTSTKGDAVASRAVDGNTNPYFGNASCSETDPGDMSMWQVLSFLCDQTKL